LLICGLIALGKIVLRLVVPGTVVINPGALGTVLMRATLFARISPGFLVQVTPPSATPRRLSFVEVLEGGVLLFERKHSGRREYGELLDGLMLDEMGMTHPPARAGTVHGRTARRPRS
jgi:hypothetical protein